MTMPASGRQRTYNEGPVLLNMELTLIRFMPEPDSFVAPDTVTFKDDDGSVYVPPRDLILPRQLAIEAFRGWLIDQAHPPMLRWD